MREKYFTIEKESEFYKAWFHYIKVMKENIQLFNEFAEKHKIESSSFIPSRKRLCIVPSENDIAKFQNEFTKQDDENIRQFKVRSEIGKDWAKVTKDIEIARKPDYFNYGLRVGGPYSTRCFHIDDIIYGSYEAKECSDFTLMDFMKEIKASEFYKIIEDEREKKEK